MEGGPDRRRSSILTDRSQDRGFYRAVAVSVGVHVLFLLVLFVGGDLDLRPDSPETYAAGLAGGLPPGLEARLPDLGGQVPQVDPAPPPPAPPKPADRKPPPDRVAAAEPVNEKSDEPADLILPAPATATPEATASPTPRPTPSPTPSPGPTASPAPTSSPSPVPTAIATPVATATPTPAPIATRSPKPEPTASPAPTVKPKPKPKPKPTATKKPEKEKTAPAPTAKPAAKNQGPEQKNAPAAKDEPTASTKKTGDATETGEERKRTTPRSAALDPTVRARGETAAERDARIAAAMDRVRARVGSGTSAGGTGGTGGTGGGGAGVGGAGSGTGGFGTGAGAGGALRGADFLLYYNEMITRIRDAWVWVGGSADLEVEVGFRVTPSGDIVDIRTVRASGDRSYDESVLRALRTVRNLGPPPERHRETFSQVQLTFRPADLESGP